MITYLVKKPNYYICGNCRMKQQELHENCWFCGCIFSNYENVILENYKEQENNKEEMSMEDKIIYVEPVDPEVPEVEVDFISDDDEQETKSKT